jgi:hypothetical protein
MATKQGESRARRLKSREKQINIIDFYGLTLHFHNSKLRQNKSGGGWYMTPSYFLGAAQLHFDLC